MWETLEETEGIDTFLPEWEQVRLLPHASVVHRFTVDRHMVETCIEASSLIRRVARPDVLMVAALLHDIGKGRLVEHSVAGEPVAREIAARIGFDDREVELVGHLVRWHLLLPETATTRDPDDPSTVATVTDRIPEREELELLLALTEADARATSEKAWTSWRSSLVLTLFRRAMNVLSDQPVSRDEDPNTVVPDKIRADPSKVWVEVEPTDDGSQVTVVSGDRIGLLADAAAMLALQRAPGARGPGLDRGRRRRLGVAGRRHRARPERAAAAAGEHRRGPPRRRGPGWPDAHRSRWSPPSPYAPRRRRGRPCWRSARPTSPV